MARTHRELEAWQLAHEVRCRFIELTARDLVKRDYGFCDDTNRAARSACRNLAEGFRRRSHREFARFVEISIGSLAELHDSVDEAELKKYLVPPEADEWRRLIDRAIQVARALYAYLVRTDRRPSPSPGHRQHRN